MLIVSFAVGWARDKWWAREAWWEGKYCFVLFFSLRCAHLLSSIIVKLKMMFMIFSFPQGLPGFVGPPGQMGIAGEKVKNVFNLSSFARITVICCCSLSFVILSIDVVTAETMLRKQLIWFVILICYCSHLSKPAVLNTQICNFDSVITL